MEQKNSCFVFFIVRLINQCVPPFFMWRQINSSTYVRAEPESSTILKGKKKSPLDTILSQLYPTPILNLSQLALPHSTFAPIFGVRSVNFPRCLSAKVLLAWLLSLTITAAAIHSTFLHFAILAAKEAILCHSQSCVCV